MTNKASESRLSVTSDYVPLVDEDHRINSAALRSSRRILVVTLVCMVVFVIRFALNIAMMIINNDTSNPIYSALFMLVMMFLTEVSPGVGILVLMVTKVNAQDIRREINEENQDQQAQFNTGSTGGTGGGGGNTDRVASTNRVSIAKIDNKGSVTSAMDDEPMSSNALDSLEPKDDDEQNNVFRPDTVPEEVHERLTIRDSGDEGSINSPKSSSSSSKSSKSSSDFL
jgi:hypothetical protein